MTVEVDIAIAGAHSLAGQAVVKMLAERRFPIAQLFPLDEAEYVDETVEYGKHFLAIKPLDDFDFTQVQILISCLAGGAQSDAILQSAVQNNCLVIDTAHASRLNSDVPLVIPEINPQAIQTAEQNLWASPDSHVVQLLVALEPLRQQQMLRRVVANCLQPVSAYGQAGIDELSGQTIALFNMQEVKTKQFSQQIAFNVLSAAGELYPSLNVNYHLGLHREIQRICPATTTEFVLNLVNVPVFFGHSHNISIELENDVEIDDIVNIYAESPLVKYIQDTDSVSVVKHAALQNDIYIGPIEKATETGNQLNIWTVADNFCRGVAINCVQMAEILVKDYL